MVLNCLFDHMLLERPPISVSWPSEISELIEKCWSSKPRGRPSFDDISAELLFLDIKDDQ